MINENSTGLNGTPPCVNVFPINLERNHSIQLKRELRSILNGMPLLNSNESQ
jgi:hypothetical protein